MIPFFVDHEGRPVRGSTPPSPDVEDESPLMERITREAQREAERQSTKTTTAR